MTYKTIGNMAHKTTVTAESMTHCTANDAHKTVKVVANMTHNASHSFIVVHDEMKNNF